MIHRQTRRRLLKGATATTIVSSLLALTAAAPATGARMERAKGAVAVDPAVYAELPKVRTYRAFLPDVVDLSGRFPAVGDQEWQTSCVAWATGYAARSFLHAPDLGHAPQAREDLVSPAYVFYRVRDNKAQCVGSGSTVAAALELLKSEGAVSLAEMPYSVYSCHQAPTETQIASAAKWRIGGWRAIQRQVPNDWRSPVVLDDVKGQLAAGLPVVFTMPSPKRFDDWAGDAVYETDDQTGGLHAMALVGYDEHRQAFRLINSWGRQWGDHGYAWISYQTFARLAREAYVMEPPGGMSRPPQAPVQLSVPPEQRLQTIAEGAGCGRIALSAAAGRRQLTGFMGDAQAWRKAEADARAVDPAVGWNVALRPWPQCEAELTLAQALVQPGVSLATLTEAGAARGGDPVALRMNELFAIRAQVSKATPYLHVIYVQADGSAVELYRGAPPLHDAAGGREIVLGASGEVARRFQVQPPLGDEVLLAVASSGPLFGPEIQGGKTEREFLTLLRASLAQAGRDGRPVAASIQRLRSAAD